MVRVAPSGGNSVEELKVFVFFVKNLTATSEYI